MRPTAEGQKLYAWDDGDVVFDEGSALDSSFQKFNPHHGEHGHFASADLIGGKFRQGSAMGNLYNGLADGTPKKLSEMRQLVSTVGNPDGRIAAMKKIGEQSGQWKLHVDKANDSIHMQHTIPSTVAPAPSVTVAPSLLSTSLVPAKGPLSVSAIVERGAAIDSKLQGNQYYMDTNKVQFAKDFRAAADLPATPSGSLKVTYGKNLSDSQQQATANGVFFLNNLIGNGYVTNQLRATHTDVARASQAGAKIMLPKSVNPATVVHETGHWIEENRNDVYAAATSFLKDRFNKSSGENAKIRPLNELGSVKTYGSHERAFKDNFDSAYTGKIYATGTAVHATEVISMGFEQLYRSPNLFRQIDPHYYHFMLGVAAHVASTPDVKKMRIKMPTIVFQK